MKCYVARIGWDAGTIKVCVLEVMSREPPKKVHCPVPKDSYRHCKAQISPAVSPNWCEDV